MSGSLEIETQPQPDGSYLAVLHLGEDTSLVLTTDSVCGYAADLIWAACCAEYDAAVLAQLGERGRDGGGTKQDESMAALVVTAVRDRRAERVPSPPLTLVPGVSAATRKPFLTLQINGKTVGQLSASDAREHALTAMQAVAYAQLDSDYATILTQVGIDESRRMAVIKDVGKYFTS